ncbi:hypothetical protein J132_01129 [Termitomyces sp. J132]|nr:hypothetical protein J132_01129 [Termitomyces sp. J132]
MSIFTEVSYAAFLFGGGNCEVSVSGCTNMDLLDLFDLDMLSLVLTSMMYPSTDFDIPVQTRFSTLYRLSDALREANECLADPDGYLEKKKKKIAFITKYMEWKQSRQNLYNKTVAANETFSNQLAQEKGWVHWDLMSSTPYGSMHRLKNSRIERVTRRDYDSIADEVKRTFVHLAILRERKAREAAYANTRYAVEQHHQRLRSQLPHIVLPSLDVFRRLPIVQLLQGTSPETVDFPLKESPHDVSTTLRKEKWVVERLNEELCQWREKVRKGLAAVLGYPNWITSNENTNSEVLHPVDRVTARFLCKTCSRVASRYREDDCLDYAGACAHFCPGKKDKQVNVWAAGRFVKDEKAIAVLQKLLALCETDASCPEAAATLESLGMAIQCTSCGPGIVMNSRSLVGHSHRHEKMMIRVLSKEEVSNVLLHPPQPFIVRNVTGSEPRLKSVETQPQLERQLTLLETESSQQPKSMSSPEASTSAKQACPKTKQVVKRFSFPGINSHLKEKYVDLSSTLFILFIKANKLPRDRHGISDPRDEDIFSFDPIELPSQKKK